MFEALATGSWLTQPRIRAVCGIMLATTVLLYALLFATAHGTLDSHGRPLGTDFAAFWSAGRMALDGHAALAWDWKSIEATHAAIHGAKAASENFVSWHYPPPFLLIATLCALLPYVWGLLLWQASSLGAATWVAQRILPGRDAMLAVLGAPAVFICLGHGQNGFLTAALLGGGLLLLDRRPIVAGMLLGCLIYKPQLALVLPLILIAGGHWRALFGAAAAALLLVAITLALWGWPVWQAFLDSLPLARHVLIEQGRIGWHKIQSAFAAVRMLGGSVGLAYAIQSVVSLGAIAGAVVGARIGNASQRAALTICATLLATPYVIDYEFATLGIATAFLIADGRKQGFLRWEKSLYAFAWLMPLFARIIAGATHMPVGLLTMTAIFALALRRTLTLRSSPSRH